MYIPEIIMLSVEDLDVVLSTLCRSFEIQNEYRITISTFVNIPMLQILRGLMPSHRIFSDQSLSFPSAK